MVLLAVQGIRNHLHLHCVSNASILYLSINFKREISRRLRCLLVLFWYFLLCACLSIFSLSLTMLFLPTLSAILFLFHTLLYWLLGFLDTGNHLLLLICFADSLFGVVFINDSSIRLV